MVPFKYGDFYDVPRVVMFHYRNHHFLLGSYFDDEKDDYDESYLIQILPSWVEQKIAESGSWEVLRNVNDARLLGEVAVKDIVFDPTKRRMLDPSFLDAYLTPEKS